VDFFFVEAQGLTTKLHERKITKRHENFSKASLTRGAMVATLFLPGVKTPG
jgi:hypothetical protein